MSLTLALSSYDRQKFVLLVIAVAMALMILFPPFHIRFNGGEVINLGYGFLLNPQERIEHGRAGSVDIAMLAMQWIATLVIGGIAYVMCKPKR